MDLNCFLIDDDTEDQEIFMMAVREVNKSITCNFANNCTDALSKLGDDVSYLPHYVFIDINMPKQNGIFCLREIKKLERLSQVPIYMYSTSADPKFIAESKKLGAVDFIIKPANIPELTSILSGLFLNWVRG